MLDEAAQICVPDRFGQLPAIESPLPRHSNSMSLYTSAGQKCLHRDGSPERDRFPMTRSPWR